MKKKYRSSTGKVISCALYLLSAVIVTGLILFRTTLYASAIYFFGHFRSKETDISLENLHYNITKMSLDAQNVIVSNTEKGKITMPHASLTYAFFLNTFELLPVVTFDSPKVEMVSTDVKNSGDFTIAPFLPFVSKCNVTVNKGTVILNNSEEKRFSFSYTTAITPAYSGLLLLGAVDAQDAHMLEATITRAGTDILVYVDSEGIDLQMLDPFLHSFVSQDVAFSSGSARGHVVIQLNEQMKIARCDVRASVNGVHMKHKNDPLCSFENTEVRFSYPLHKSKAITDPLSNYTLYTDIDACTLHLKPATSLSLQGSVGINSSIQDGVALTGVVSTGNHTSSLSCNGHPYLVGEDKSGVGLRLSVNSEGGQSSTIDMHAVKRSPTNFELCAVVDSLSYKHARIIKHIAAYSMPDLENVSIESGTVQMGCSLLLEGLSPQKVTIDTLSISNAAFSHKAIGAFVYCNSCTGVFDYDYSEKKIVSWGCDVREGSCIVLDESGEKKFQDINLHINCIGQDFETSFAKCDYNGIGCEVDFSGSRYNLLSDVSFTIPSHYIYDKNTRENIDYIQCLGAIEYKKDTTDFRGKVCVGDSIVYLDCKLNQILDFDHLPSRDAIDWKKNLSGSFSTHRVSEQVYAPLVQLYDEEYTLSGDIACSGDFADEKATLNFSSDNISIDTPAFSTSFSTPEKACCVIDMKNHNVIANLPFSQANFVSKEHGMSCENAKGILVKKVDHWSIDQLSCLSQNLNVSGRIDVWLDEGSPVFTTLGVTSLQGDFDDLKIFASPFTSNDQMNLIKNGTVYGGCDAFHLDWDMKSESFNWSLSLDIKDSSCDFSNIAIEDMNCHLDILSQKETVRISHLKGTIRDTINASLMIDMLEYTSSRGGDVYIKGSLESPYFTVAEFESQVSKDETLFKSEWCEISILDSPVKLCQFSFSDDGVLKKFDLEHTLKGSDINVALSHSPLYNHLPEVSKWKCSEMMFKAHAEEGVECEIVCKGIETPWGELGDTSLVCKGPSWQHMTIAGSSAISAISAKAHISTSLLIDEITFDSPFISLSKSALFYDTSDGVVMDIGSLTTKKSLLTHIHPAFSNATSSGHVICSLGGITYHATFPEICVDDTTFVTLNPCTIAYSSQGTLTLNEFHVSEKDDGVSSLYFKKVGIDSFSEDVICHGVKCVCEKNNAIIKQLLPEGVFSRLQTSIDDIIEIEGDLEKKSGQFSFSGTIAPLHVSIDGIGIDASVIECDVDESRVYASCHAILGSKKFFCEFDVTLADKFPGSVGVTDISTSLKSDINFVIQPDFSITKLRGDVGRSEFEFFATNQEDGIITMEGGVSECCDLLSRYVPKGDSLRDLKGLSLQGECVIDIDHPRESFFEGVISGKECSVYDTELESIIGAVHVNDRAVSLRDVCISDSAMFCKVGHFEFNLSSNNFVIRDIIGEEIRPSLFRHISKKNITLTPLLFRDIAIDIIEGNSDDVSSITGQGSLHFINTFERDGFSNYTPFSVLSNIGLDAGLMVPIEGGINFELLDGKLYLRELSNCFSTGKRSHFYFPTDANAIDWSGECSIDVKMKQYVLFKIAQPFTLNITGTVNEPSFELKK